MTFSIVCGVIVELYNHIIEKFLNNEKIPKEEDKHRETNNMLK